MGKRSRVEFNPVLERVERRALMSGTATRVPVALGLHKDISLSTGTTTVDESRGARHGRPFDHALRVNATLSSVDGGRGIGGRRDNAEKPTKEDYVAYVSITLVNTGEETLKFDMFTTPKNPSQNGRVTLYRGIATNFQTGSGAGEHKFELKALGLPSASKFIIDAKGKYKYGLSPMTANYQLVPEEGVGKFKLEKV